MIQVLRHLLLIPGNGWRIQLEDDIPAFPSPGPRDPYPAAEPSAPSAAAPPSVAAPADDTMDSDGC